MADRAELFPAAAFPENRSGHMTNEQARNFERMVSGRRQSIRGVAMPVGAVGKRRLRSTSHGTGWTRYYLIIGGCQLRAYRSAYEAAPDAGYCARVLSASYAAVGQSRTSP